MGGAFGAKVLVGPAVAMTVRSEKCLIGVGGMSWALFVPSLEDERQVVEPEGSSLHTWSRHNGTVSAEHHILNNLSNVRGVEVVG